MTKAFIFYFLTIINIGNINDENVAFSSFLANSSVLAPEQLMPFPMESFKSHLMTYMFAQHFSNVPALALLVQHGVKVLSHPSFLKMFLSNSSQSFLKVF